MMPTSHRNSQPDRWVLPRPHTDPCQRLLKHGPIRPMDEDRGLLWRFFIRR